MAPVPDRSMLRPEAAAQLERLEADEASAPRVSIFDVSPSLRRDASSYAPSAEAPAPSAAPASLAGTSGAGSSSGAGASKPSLPSWLDDMFDD